VDPEQIYSEVLADEQAKGSPSVVAEARAKAARQRAVHGSPHPKEPKWWPGAQPHLEGGDAEPAQDPPAAEAEPVEEEAPAPAAEMPAAESPPPPAEPVAAPQELDRDLAQAPAGAPSQPAAATAPVPVGTAAAPTVAAPAATATLPSGVTHGTPGGNRLRPEDAVATESQFDAQAAMRQRRKMIDELVSTGVPALAAADGERRSGAGMLLLYLLIPLVAVFFLVNNQDQLAGGGGEAPPAADGGGGGEGLTIAAANVQFDKDQLTIPADGASLRFVNEDTAEHNVAIYQDDSASEDIFVGQVIPGGQEVTYDIPGHEPGDYYFQCDVHPAMNGTATFE
jgi:plastocyanin